MSYLDRHGLNMGSAAFGTYIFTKYLHVIDIPSLGR